MYTQITRSNSVSDLTKWLIVCLIVSIAGLTALPSAQAELCGSTPCQNDGTCTENCSEGCSSYTCSCASGYSGTHCSTDIDDCADDPCKNGGTCNDGVNSYSCSCISGFTGRNCADISQTDALPTGLIVGLTLGAIVLVGLVVFVVVIWCFLKKKQNVAVKDAGKS